MTIPSWHPPWRVAWLLLPFLHLILLTPVRSQLTKTPDRWPTFQMPDIPNSKYDDLRIQKIRDHYNSVSTSTEATLEVAHFFVTHAFRFSPFSDTQALAARNVFTILAREGILVIHPERLTLKVLESINRELRAFPLLLRTINQVPLNELLDISDLKLLRAQEGQQPPPQAPSSSSPQPPLQSPPTGRTSLRQGKAPPPQPTQDSPSPPSPPSPPPSIPQSKEEVEAEEGEEEQPQQEQGYNYDELGEDEEEDDSDGVDPTIVRRSLRSECDCDVKRGDFGKWHVKPPDKKAALKKWALKNEKMSKLSMIKTAVAIGKAMQHFIDKNEFQMFLERKRAQYEAIPEYDRDALEAQMSDILKKAAAKVGLTPEQIQKAGSRMGIHLPLREPTTKEDQNNVNISASASHVQDEANNAMHQLALPISKPADSKIMKAVKASAKKLLLSRVEVSTSPEFVRSMQDFITEAQRVRAGMDGSSPQSMDEAMRNFTTQVRYVANKLESVNMTQVLQTATQLLLKVEKLQNYTKGEAMEETAAMLRLEGDDVDLWHIIVALDGEMQDTETRRSYKVPLRNKSILLGIQMLNDTRPAAVAPLNLTLLHDITEDGAVDMNELVLLRDRIDELNDIYNLTDLAKLMIQVEDLYDGKLLPLPDESQGVDPLPATTIIDTITPPVIKKKDPIFAAASPPPSKAPEVKQVPGNAPPPPPPPTSPKKGGKVEGVGPKASTAGKARKPEKASKHLRIEMDSEGDLSSEEEEGELLAP